MDKRTKVVDEYKAVQESSKAITEILESAELEEQISNSRDYRQLVEYLAKAHSVSCHKLFSKIMLKTLIGFNNNF